MHFSLGVSLSNTHTVSLIHNHSHSWSHCSLCTGWQSANSDCSWGVVEGRVGGRQNKRARNSKAEFPKTTWAFYSVSKTSKLWERLNKWGLLYFALFGVWAQEKKIKKISEAKRGRDGAVISAAWRVTQCPNIYPAIYDWGSRPQRTHLTHNREVSHSFGHSLAISLSFSVAHSHQHTHTDISDRDRGKPQWVRDKPQSAVNPFTVGKHGDIRCDLKHADELCTHTHTHMTVLLLYMQIHRLATEKTPL